MEKAVPCMLGAGLAIAVAGCGLTTHSLTALNSSPPISGHILREIGVSRDVIVQTVDSPVTITSVPGHRLSVTYRLPRGSRVTVTPSIAPIGRVAAPS